MAYMDKASLVILHHSTKAWPLRRVLAHLGSIGIEAKRCSASEYIWPKWCAIADISIDIITIKLVEAWAEIEYLEKLLQPVKGLYDGALCTMNPYDRLGAELYYDIKRRLKCLKSLESTFLLEKP